MKTKLISTIAIVALSLIGLASSVSSAYARNEITNGVFREGHRINPIQGDLGVARYVMIVPSPDPRAGQEQYFEKCWNVQGGYACKYEVLFNGRTSPQHGAPSGHDDQIVAHNQNSGAIEDDWAGKFNTATKDGVTWFATVRVNGKQVVETYKLCQQGNGKHGYGWYCDPNA